MGWLYKNKDHGMMSATASIGLILLWDVDGGLTQIDKYLYSPEDYIKAGALLACGIVNTGVKNDCDPALALLSDYVDHASSIMTIGAIFGLGLAYAGSNRSDLVELLLPVFSYPKSSMEVIGITALACGLICVGTCNEDVTTTILQVLMEKAEATVEALAVLPDPFKSMAMTMVDICAYAGTGNVLKIQSLLHICSEHFEPEKTDKETEKKDKKGGKSEASDSSKKSAAETEKKTEKENPDLSSQQAVAVIGLALIAMPM